MPGILEEDDFGIPTLNVEDIQWRTHLNPPYNSQSGSVFQKFMQNLSNDDE